jgi:hypothetical protein
VPGDAIWVYAVFAALAVVVITLTRERYFQVHPTRTSRVISHRELSLLGGQVDVGDAGRLVLQFGPHRARRSDR